MSNAATEVSKAFVEAVAKVGGSIARIEGDGCGPRASGVAFSEDGVVVTSAHAVEGRDEVEIAIGDATFKGKVLGVERALDLGVVKVDGKLTVPAWAKAEDVGVGTLALIVGRPGKSVRASLALVGVRGDDVKLPFGGRIDTYLELDRGAGRGFAGGAVIDAEGRVVGLTTSLRHATIALPHGAVKKAVDEIVAHGKVRRGYLGVGVQPVRLPNGAGALVVAVAPKSAAERDGVLVGDVLLTIDGVAVKTPGDLAEVLRDRLDAKVKLHLVRAGKELDLEVTTGARP